MDSLCVMLFSSKFVREINELIFYAYAIIGYVFNESSYIPNKNVPWSCSISFLLNYAKVCKNIYTIVI